MRANEEIRRAMGANGLKQWHIAEAIGMNDGNFSRKLRQELLEEEKKKLLAVIEALAEKGASGEHFKLEIKIKYLRDIEKIKEIAVGDWIDLRAAEDVAIKAGEYRMIPLGVAMELPKGFEALVAPRSSAFRKYGVLLANSIGIIDETYKGDNDEWNFLAYAVRDTVIPKNERICQFRIIEHQPGVELVEVDTLGNPDRGGIGSTGRR